MACIITGLRDQLLGAADPGGRWTFESTTNPGNDLTVDVDAGGITTYALGAFIGLGDNPSVDFSAAVDADYVLRYTTGIGGSCQDTADLTVTIVNGVTAGINVGPITICNTDNVNYTIHYWLDGGDGLTTGGGLITPPGGTVTYQWTGNGPAHPTAFNDQGNSDPSDDTFNPLNVTPGSYFFNYTLDQTAGNDACADCEDTKVVEVIVAAAPNPGGDASMTVCSSPS